MRCLYVVIRLFLFLCFIDSSQSQPLLRPFEHTIPQSGINSQELFLPKVKPIGASDFVSIKDGHFQTPDGKRIKFVGTSLYYTACYPDSADAILVAKRLSSLGFNAVRFVAYDYAFWFLEPGNASIALNEVQIKRLDWFVYQLKLHGIYIYLPVHSNWQPRPGDGVAKWDTVPVSMPYVEVDFRQAHKRVVRMLMEHINPYTGVAWKDEPAFAIMDLTYESSLTYLWQQGRLTKPTVNYLTDYHVKRLDTIFSLYLQEKYKNDLALKANWSSPPSSPTNIVTNGGFEDAGDPLTGWQLYVNENAKSVVFPSDGNKVEGERSANIRVTQTAGTGYFVQFVNQSCKLEKYRSYEMRFSAKTTATVGTRSFIVVAQKGMYPFNVYGLYYTDVVTANWKEYVIRFRANTTDSSTVNLSFYLGEQIGDFYLDNVRLRSMDDVNLFPGESMSNFTIKRAEWNDNTISAARMADNAVFYTALMKDYTDKMYSFLKDTLKVRASVSGGTQPQYFNDLFSFSGCDFTAEFEGWGSNGGMVSDKGAGAYPNLARAKIRDKPMIVAGMLMPYPSAHQNEMATILPAYSAYQDWDGFFLTYYADIRTTITKTTIDSGQFYQLRSNSALLSMMPQASRAFQTGMIAPAKKTIGIHHSIPDLYTPQWQNGSFWLDIYSDQRMVLFRKVQIDSLNATQQSELPHRSVSELSGDNGVDTKNLLSDTEELLWNADDSVFTISTPGYIAATGALGGKIFTFGSIRAERLDAGNIGSFSWISGDTLPLADSRSSLLTVSTRALSRGTIWNSNQSVTNWGNTTVEVEAMTLRLSFDTKFDSISVTPIDSTGKRMNTPLTVNKLSKGKFAVTIDQSKNNTMWFAINQLGTPTSVISDNETSTPLTLTVLQSTMNEAQVVSSFPQSGASSRITLTNGIGATTELWNGTAAGQTEYVRVPMNLPSGMYIVRVASGTQITTVKFMIVKKWNG
ncbi:MAG: carbohydrate binding domain-containing protein [Ignavibacteria bacterium]|nr:carbohydrate binding domain-containing protein [Ignavibacteria bacterium]